MQDKDLKTKRWLDLREYILRRDKYLCQHSKRYGVNTDAEVVHHIWPRELYPEYAWCKWNLISLTHKAHNAMHDRERHTLTLLGEEYRKRYPPPSK
jgi:5-methylcytosine-specific restriction endonuclease McrA